MKNKNEGIFNSIKPKATFFGSNEMKTESEIIDVLNKFAKKQVKPKKEVRLEDFRCAPLSKIIILG